MKNIRLFYLIFVFLMIKFPQENLAQNRKLTPIAGHYKQLAAYSVLPLPDSTDRIQFPLEGLSPKNPLKLLLKPQYLLLPVSEFKIPNFPPNSSPQTNAEIEFLLKLQATERSDEKVKESKLFANVYYDVFVKPSDEKYEKMQNNLFHMGRQLPWFKPKNLPNTAALMTKLWSDCTYYFWALKFQYNRTRPYMLDKRIVNLDNTNFQAYPSGHASASYVAAFVFQELIPEAKELFLKNAYEMAYSREILGVHFPSDSEAGRIFARQFVNELLKNKNFMADFELAINEIKLLKINK
jgi:acid phosphatase (class A)